MKWIEWFHRIATIAQAGLTYTRDDYDRERYEQLRTLAAEVLAEHTRVSEADARDLLARQIGYPTPKVDVRAVVFRDGRLLLVREADDGGWTLPGGWADLGDSPGEVAVREAREESGYETQARRLLAVLDKNKHAHPPQVWAVYKIFVQCELTGGAPRTSLETTDVGFFGRDELPALSVNRVTERQLQLMFQHLDDPARPADFD